MAFKVLHWLLVFLRRGFCLEGAKISSFTRIRIFLAGIQPILAGFQLPDHAPSNIRTQQAARVELWATPECFRGCQTNRRQAERLPYVCLAKRFENQSASSAARIPRLVARCAGKLQCWLA